MKRILLLLFTLIALGQASAQISPNRDYTVYQGGPDLVLNPVPNPSCNGTCSSGRICMDYGYSGPGVTFRAGRLVCSFNGPKTISEMIYREVYMVDRASGECELRTSDENEGGMFTVTGIDFKWANASVILCPSSAPFNLAAAISYASGTTFSGPGVSGTMFNAASAGTGTFTITASKTFDNGMVSRSMNVTVVERASLAASSYTACQGAGVSIGAVAGGSDLSYQWQESTDGGNMWGSISNTGIYSGANTLTLNMASVALWMNNYRYRLLVQYTCGTEIANTIATLNVQQAPVINADPLAASVCENDPVALVVSSTATSATYQWQYSTTGGAGTFNDVAGATSSTYSVTASQLSQDGFYRAVVHHACVGAGLVSQAARLAVKAITRMVTHPADQSVCPLGTVNWNVAVSGSGALVYQWEVSRDGGGPFTSVSDDQLHQGTGTATLRISGVPASLSNSFYRVRVNGECGVPAISSAAKLMLLPTPTAPLITNPSRCGDGALTATATSPASSPVFRWYTNESDQVPVYTGSAYSLTHLNQTTSFSVSVSSQGCESAKTPVTFFHYPVRPVPLGDNPLNLCVGQGPYNLENDIGDAVARGNKFTWTAGGTNYSSKQFDPAVGVGQYVVAYEPPMVAKAVPHCFLPGTRTITVTSGGGQGGITFNSELITGGNTVNLCVGDAPVDLATFPSIPSGAWNTLSGNGLSFNGNAVVFTPNQNSYTEINPNVFRYTVQVNGCTSTRDLNVYVKDNPYTPTVTGLPGVVCPGKALSLAASVSMPGTFGYEWTRSGHASPFATGATLDYTVGDQETLQVRSVNSPFGCRSQATLLTIATPFSSGAIHASKSAIPMGDQIGFSTDAQENGNAFQWNFGDGATSTEQSPSHYYYQLGHFVVQLAIQSNLGCSQTISYDGITVSGDSVGIITAKEGDVETWVRVYPNPVGDEFFVDSKRPVVSCILTDMAGRKANARVRTEDQGLLVSAPGLRPGIYILQITTSQGMSMVRIIKRE